jgi:hypothetical protein
MTDSWTHYRMMDAETRPKVFWLLKRLSSYSLWERKRVAWERFTHAYEQAVKTWPASQPEQMPADNLPRIYDILSYYNKGLPELRKGNRSVWRDDGPLERAIANFWVAASFLYPHGDYWERGIQEAPYPPKVEELNKLMRASEYLGEEAPLEPPDRLGATALIAGPGWLLDPETYQHRFYTLPYPVFPEPLPEVPEPTDVMVRSGQRIPEDGIWEPVKVHRNKLLGFIPTSEKEVESNGCFNYFIQGAKAPRVTGDFNEALDRFEIDDTHWRLVWKDKRYKDGVIPDESEYFLDPPRPVVPDEAVVKDVRTHDICPASGLWEPIGYKHNPPIQIAAGAVMPDLSVRDAKGEMIIHYVKWRLIKRD